MFDRVLMWSHQVLGFCFFGRFFFITLSISVLVIGLFIISISSWFNLGRLNFSKNLSISSWLSILLPYAAATAAKSLQSCPTPCNPVDSSPPGSPIPGILQARTLEWAAISFSNAWKWKVKVKSLSRVWLFTTPWTAAYQAPPSMGFSRQAY